MSSTFPIAILNDTRPFRSVKAIKNWKQSAIELILRTNERYLLPGRNLLKLLF